MPGVDTALLIVVAALVLAYVYAFVGGFTDAANATTTSAIMGVGSLQGRRNVRWVVVGEIVQSWLLTLPATICFGYLFAALVQALVGRA